MGSEESKQHLPDTHSLKMRHRHTFRKLNRSGAHRKAMLKTMVTQLVYHERIETTVAKAKEVSRMTDRMITIAKRGTLTDLRKLFSYMQTKDMARKTFRELSERFRHRNGGYTRVLKTRFRRGDCAPMAVIELSETDKTILTRQQLEHKEARKTKHRRQAKQPVGLQIALD